ncbi:MAG: class I SAM-dependent methyltransferase [Bryobacteraceae bacterium]
MSKRSASQKASDSLARGSGSRTKKKMSQEEAGTSVKNVPAPLPEFTGDHYQTVLKRIHAVLKPRSYLEIGTLQGATLMLARCAAIAVDPHIRLEKLPAESMPALCLFQMKSDDFFKAHDPRSILGMPMDVAFIDGMHLVEYALRDFIHTEKACHAQSVIVLHDCVPLDHPMAVRDMSDRTRRALSVHPEWWTGDVWKILEILARYRPDLTVEVFNAPPTGLVLVRRLDPDSRVLADHYDEIVAEFRTPADESALFAKMRSRLEIKDTAKLAETLSELLVSSTLNPALA